MTENDAGRDRVYYQLKKILVSCGSNFVVRLTSFGGVIIAVEVA